MLSGWLLALTVAASPGQCGPGGCGMGGGMEFSPGMASGSFVAGQGGFSNPYDSVSAGGGGGGDQLYPFDSPEPWLHGYFQELPAHPGYASFRPHNYKHVLAQMEVASRWGISPVMAYSHQWYHKYRQRSGMHPNFGMGGSASLEQPSFGHVADYQDAGQAAEQQYAPAAGPTSTNGRMTSLQQAAAFQQGYTGTGIPGITTPYYQRTSSSPVAAPIESVSADYLERMDQLQKQLEEQTFQMQLMQQRMQSQDKSQLPAWQQPNHMQFQDHQSAQEPRQLQQFAAAPAQGYQELPTPGAFSQPAYGQPGQQGPAYSQSAPQNYAPQGYPQGQPAYQSAPQYQSAPTQGYPLGHGAQPTYQQPATGQNLAPAMNPIMTVPPQGQAMQVPQGQSYFSTPQNAAPGYSMPSQQPITGTQAVWQQNAGQPAGPAYSGQYGAAAQQPLVPQQPYQQLQYTQQGTYPQSGYQQMPASGQGAYYRQ